MSVTTTNELLVLTNKVLNDPGYIKWPKQELLDYLNDAQKAIVIRRPDSFTIDIDTFSCVAGTKQTIPDEGLRLIDVTRNSNGKPIKGPFDREILDDNIPTWHSTNNATAAEVYVYDERNPKTFYLHPGVTAETLITLVYSKAPDIITLEQNDDSESPSKIDLDDIYKNAISEFMLYRCYAKDAEYAADPNKSSMHFTAFRSELGEKTQADGAMAGKTKD